MKFIKSIWKDKLSRAWLIVTLVVFVLGLAINLVLTQNSFIYNTINSVLGGEVRVHVSGDPSQYQYFTSDYPDKASTLAAANALNEKIVEEGIVLLKNENGALPIATPESDSKVSVRPKISVFGKNSVNLVYGGSGSGGASSKGAVTLYESLESAGYDCNPVLKRFYESSESGSGRPSSPQMGDILAGFETGETPVSSYNKTVKESYSSYNSAAFVVISRIGGEGYDLPRTMKTDFTDGAAKINGARNAEDHYLQLDQNETDMIKEAAANFDKVIVIINSAEAMELGFLDDSAHYAYSDKIKGALWIGSVGKTGINALGRILNGTVNPSGRTVDTYARNFKNDPTWQNFGNNNVTDGNRYFVSGKKRAAYATEYEEGIYVGYRYWETRGYVEAQKGNSDWYKQNVVYPMGYGKSYTEFSWELVNGAELRSAELNEKSVLTVKVKVTNTGNVAGKDVVQLYVTAPYEKNGIEKAHVVLAGFEKTPMLYPQGEADGSKPASCVLEINVPVYYFASYDYSDANRNGNRGYEIEAGDYGLKICRDAHTVEDEVILNVDEMLIKNDVETGSKVENRFDDVSSYIKKYMSRADFEGTFPAPPTKEERTVEQSFIDSLNYTENDVGQKWTATEKPNQSKRQISYNDTKVKLYNLIDKPYKHELWDELLDQLTVQQMVQMIGTGNYNTTQIPNIAKPRTTDPDGPVGFTAFMGDPSVYDTCFYASGCIVGATYNKELAFEFGEMVGNEGLIGNAAGDGRPYSGWYAPAVNIHRSPFSGRNWEYYSEDGYLSGIMAANVIQGAKSKGVYCYVKHFALNDQETNRSNNGILSWANEQSMREIYLRAFEITVKDGETTAMMSSFNRIGKTWAGGSYELLTEVLRGEWGFKGMVVTDYNYATPYMNVDQMLRAGGDLNLSQANYPSSTDSPTQVTVLRNATKNILYTVASSNAMNGLGDGVIYRYDLPMWVRYMLIGDAVLVAVLAALGTLAVLHAVKKDKKSSETASESGEKSETNG